MDYIFKDWLKAIEKLQDSLEKDVEEVRIQKDAVQRMKKEILNDISAGRYIRDDRRIVISAPEIVIGNVDMSGDLWGDGSYSKVTIRANEVETNGVSRAGDSSGGSITNRATSIQNIAADPGIDGLENVVRPNSQIVNQARSIILQSNDENGYFSQPLSSAGGSGVLIHADSAITVDATRSNARHSELLAQTEKSLKEEQKELKERVSKSKTTVSSIISEIQKALDSTEGKNGSMEDVFANRDDLLDLQESYESMTMSLFDELTAYLHGMSALAETNRALSALGETKKLLDSEKSDFKKVSTGSIISLNSENVSVNSIDGDGNVRENDSASFSVNAKHVNFASLQSDGTLIKDGSFTASSENLTLSTANSKPDKDNTDFLATGTMRLLSKDISIAAVDYEVKEDQIKEKALSKNGSVLLRAENVSVVATTPEGKCDGNFSINAKNIGIKSMDVGKDSLEEKELAAGSSMVLVSEKMYVGALEKDKNKSKQFQLASEKIGVIAKTTAEIQQDKATVQLDGGNLSLSGGKTAVFGDTAVNGKTEFKADVKAPKLTADNIEASKSFKSTNISDGIAVPGAPSSAKLSQKIKEEEAPKPVLLKEE